MIKRCLRSDLAGCGLLLVGLMLSLAIFSFDPADPPGTTVYPPHRDVANLLGPGGAWLARTLLEAFGTAVYVLLTSWFMLIGLLWVRRRFLVWSLRVAGWFLLIPCAAVTADVINPDFVAGAAGGSGGTVGAWLHDWLEATFSVAGTLVFLGGCICVALALALDFLFAPLARLLGNAIRWLFRRLSPSGRGSVPTPRRRPQKPAEPQPSPESPIIEPTGENPEIPIRHHDEAGASVGQRPDVAEETPAPRLVPIIRPAPELDEERFADYELPPLSLLDEPEPFPYEEHDHHLRERANLLEKTFADFGLNVHVVGINTGPVITQYEVGLETGLRVHKVTALADDLALNLKVPSVRMVAPIPGKNTVGIEIPNEHRGVVRLKEVILSAGKRAAKFKIPLFLGKDTEGRPLVYDLADMPHLLIAGRTGTGKSVCMNAIVLSILMTRRPDEVKMIMIDPKMLELSEYGRIPHLMHPVVKDMRKAEAILAWAVDKMEERYDLLSRARVRSIAAYNELTAAEIHRRVQPADEEERDRIPYHMPYIVIFVDEMNDLMMTMRKEVEGHIIRLAQKSRAAGIHLVVATQKPTVDVITGLIKSNLPARICFQVSSRSDSRVVLDEMGADKLLGKGDMLFLQPGTSTLIRSQGTYASDEEITRVVTDLGCEPCYAQELVQLSTAPKEGKGSLTETLRARDDLYEQAIEVIIREGRGSVSLLQRALGIGYGRA
ncbi:MAG TPA: DNA translocase FtsK 4TM domain-containing protein, partial [Gemmataceae bacterium]|nr:DNA translocase FtsK 4TM domain-containing protein [Gemmataceae bacterium]